MGKLNIIGMGYIGFPTALIFAANGEDVVGSDINHKLIDNLKKGKLSFDEEGLEEIYYKSLENNIKFETEYIRTDRYIITVPTPYISISKKIDTSYVTQSIKQVLKVCEKDTIIVIESTISPSTIDKYILPIIKNSEFKLNENIYLVYAPERIIPGKMIYELQNNPRVIGCDLKEIAEKVKSWYETFCKGKIIITDMKIAQMSKVVENTFRDINISFANELTKICEVENLDVYQLIQIANMHPRVNILNPGPGVGGHCIPVDPWFLVEDYPTLTPLINTARKINDSMPEYIIKRISNIMKIYNMKDISKIGLYGLTYKENVNDVRQSPTLQLLKKMQDNLAYGIKSYDPYINEKIVDNQYYNFDEFLNDIDLIIIMVSHNHIKENMYKLSNKIVFDTKNICGIDGCYKL